MAFSGESNPFLNFVKSEGEGGAKFSFHDFVPRHAEGHGSGLGVMEITDPLIPDEVIDFISDDNTSDEIASIFGKWKMGEASDEEKDILETNYREWLRQHGEAPIDIAA